MFFKKKMLAARWDCSERFVDDEARSGRLVATKLGTRSVRFAETDVLAYEERQRQPPPVDHVGAALAELRSNKKAS